MDDSTDPNRLAADEAPSARGYYGLPVLKTPVWRWEVWAYFFLGGLAAGSYLVASLATLFGDERDRPARRLGYLISFASISACPPLLIKDLGRPKRFLNMLRIFKPQSPMSMGVWGLLAFSGCSALQALQVLLESRNGLVADARRRVPFRLIAALGTMLGAFLGGYTGVL